jgi:hypothetical protein
MSTESDSNSNAPANSGVVSGDAKVKSLLKQAAETDQLTDRTTGVGPGRGITPPYNPSSLASLLELNGVHAAAVAKKARREVGFGFEIENIETVDEEDASEEERQRAEEFWLGPTTKWKLGPTGTPFATPEEVVEKARQDWHAVGWGALPDAVPVASEDGLRLLNKARRRTDWLDDSLDDRPAAPWFYLYDEAGAPVTTASDFVDLLDGYHVPDSPEEYTPPEYGSAEPERWIVPGLAYTITPIVAS